MSQVVLTAAFKRTDWRYFVRFQASLRQPIRYRWYEPEIKNNKSFSIQEDILNVIWIKSKHIKKNRKKLG